MAPYESDRDGFVDDRRLAIVQARAALLGRARRCDVLELVAELRNARGELAVLRGELDAAYAAVRELGAALEVEQGLTGNGASC